MTMTKIAIIIIGRNLFVVIVRGSCRRNFVGIKRIIFLNFEYLDVDFKMKLFRDYFNYDYYYDCDCDFVISWRRFYGWGSFGLNRIGVFSYLFFLFFVSGVIDQIGKADLVFLWAFFVIPLFVWTFVSVFRRSLLVGVWWGNLILTDGAKGCRSADVGVIDLVFRLMMFGNCGRSVNIALLLLFYYYFLFFICVKIIVYLCKL